VGVAADVSARVDGAVLVAPALPQYLLDTKSIADVIDNPEILNPPPPIETGFTAVDKMLEGGVVPGALYSLMGRRGGGKTTLTENMIRRITSAGIRALFITREKTINGVLRSWIASETGISVKALKKHSTLPSHVKVGVSAVKRKFAKFPFQINENTSEIDQVCHVIKFEVAKGAKIVFIDQLSWLSCNGIEIRHEAVGEIIRRLKVSARENSIPIVLLVQPNRSGAGGDHLELHHIKGSSSVEEDCDGIIAIQKSSDNTMVLEVLKNREGAVGICSRLLTNFPCAQVTDDPAALEPYSDISARLSKAVKRMGPKPRWTPTDIKKLCSIDGSTHTDLFNAIMDSKLKLKERAAKTAISESVKAGALRKPGELYFPGGGVPAEEAQ
jgi:archaellum biogenesis ATPase FlaH